MIDCQTLATIPRDEIVARLGRCAPEVMRRIDLALANALGLEDRGLNSRTSHNG